MYSKSFKEIVKGKIYVGLCSGGMESMAGEPRVMESRVDQYEFPSKKHLPSDTSEEEAEA